MQQWLIENLWNPQVRVIYQPAAATASGEDQCAQEILNLHAQPASKLHLQVKVKDFVLCCPTRHPPSNTWPGCFCSALLLFSGMPTSEAHELYSFIHQEKVRHCSQKICLQLQIGSHLVQMLQILQVLRAELRAPIREARGILKLQSAAITLYDFIGLCSRHEC